VRLNIHLHQVPTLRMSGAILLLPLYEFIEWTRTNFPLPVPSPNTKLTFLRNTDILDRRTPADLVKKFKVICDMTPYRLVW
jgi:hypothetical protein